jgi:hypothetical protein
METDLLVVWMRCPVETRHPLIIKIRLITLHKAVHADSNHVRATRALHKTKLNVTPTFSFTEDKRLRVKYKKDSCIHLEDVAGSVAEGRLKEGFHAVDTSSYYFSWNN